MLGRLPQIGRLVVGVADLIHGTRGDASGVPAWGPTYDLHPTPGSADMGSSSRVGDATPGCTRETGALRARK